MIHAESPVFLYLLQEETLFTFVPDYPFKEGFFFFFVFLFCYNKWLYKMVLIFPSGSNMRFLYCLYNKGNVSFWGNRPTVVLNTLEHLGCSAKMQTYPPGLFPLLLWGRGEWTQYFSHRTCWTVINNIPYI